MQGWSTFLSRSQGDHRPWCLLPWLRATQAGPCMGPRCIVQPAKRGDQRHCAIKNHDHVLGQDGRGHLWLGQVGARLARPWPLATAPQLHQARPSAASIATAPRFAIKAQIHGTDWSKRLAFCRPRSSSQPLIQR